MPEIAVATPVTAETAADTAITGTAILRFF
jgi:hypothetical protein